MSDSLSAKLQKVSELMICGDSGARKPILANAYTALKYDPEWEGVLAFNEFSLHTVTKKPTPWEKPAGSHWVDHDDSLTANWLQHYGVLVNSKIAAEAVQTVAKESSFHPVRNY